MKRSIVFLLVAALWLAACVGSQPQTGGTQEPVVTTPAPVESQVPPLETTEPGPTPAPAETSPSGPIPVDLPPAQLKAIEALAASQGVDLSEIQVVSADVVEWPDGCLGVQRMGVMCTQVITPGYRIVLDAGGKQYEYHTNQDGSVVVEAALGLAHGVNAGEKAAIGQLANALGIPAGQIQVVTNSSVEWPDACLGIARPGMMCAQVVTPGKSIVLEANGVQYEFHTNQDGSVVAPATVALTWHQEGGLAGFCSDLTVILPDEVDASSCKPQGGQAQGSLKELLSADERAQLDEWLAQYGEVTISMKDPATADAMTTNLVLHGRGSGQPSDSEQQAMIAWAQALFGQLQP
jgi:hypothetical protein